MDPLKRLRPGIATLIGLVLSAEVIVGCGNMNQARQGTVAGRAGVGDSVGKGRITLIGGATGALSGGLIGNYMDRQVDEFRYVAEATRADDGIIVTIKDQILFDVDRADIRPASEAEIDRIANVLKRYPKTMITVAGHTDDAGHADHNKALSERRANAVKSALIGRGVAVDRMTAMGFGPNRPVASNETPEGRAENRRVELHIVPNDELKAEAAREEG